MCSASQFSPRHHVGGEAGGCFGWLKEGVKTHWTTEFIVSRGCHFGAAEAGGAWITTQHNCV